jgi:hypothetical protein
LLFKKNCRIEAEKISCSFSRPSLFYFIYFSLIKIIFLHGFAPDEVDGMVEDTDLKKVLEMSRQETESGSLDHGLFK